MPHSDIREVEATYRQGLLVDLRIDGEEPYEVMMRSDPAMERSAEALPQPA